MAARLVLVALAALAVLAAAENDFDQFTDVSGAVRNMPRGALWQSFTAKRSGALKSIEVLMGVRYPCEAMKGTVVLRQGVPEGADAAEASESETEGAVLASLEARTTCPDAGEALEGGACSNGDCLQWQTFALPDGVRLEKGGVYHFSMSGFYSADMTRTARVGVSPHSENNGGRSSLLISPVYKTKYSQFTFRTRMGAGDEAGVSLEEQNANGGGKSGSASAGGLGTSGIIVVVVVLAVLVVLAVVAVQARRSMRRRTAVFGSSDSIGSTGSAASTDGLMRRARHPIQVRSNDTDSTDTSSLTWADTVAGAPRAEPEERARRRHASIDMTPASSPTSPGAPALGGAEEAALFGVAV